ESFAAPVMVPVVSCAAATAATPSASRHTASARVQRRESFDFTVTSPLRQNIDGARAPATNLRTIVLRPTTCQTCNARKRGKFKCVAMRLCGLGSGVRRGCVALALAGGVWVSAGTAAHQAVSAAAGGASEIRALWVTRSSLTTPASITSLVNTAHAEG